MEHTILSPKSNNHEKPLSLDINHDDDLILGNHDYHDYQDSSTCVFSKTSCTYDSTHDSTHDSTYQSEYRFEDIDFSNNIKHIYLDIDQTIGDVGKASVFYNIAHHYTKKSPPYNTVKWFFEEGAFRPGLREFIHYLNSLKERGIGVSIYTSINNYNGYVNWMVDCIEEFCGLPRIFDTIKDGQMARYRSNCGATIKELGPNEILIDDKPWNVTPLKRVIGIKPYYKRIDSLRYADYFDEQQRDEIVNILKNDEIYDVSTSYREPDDKEYSNLLDNFRKIFG